MASTINTDTTLTLGFSFYFIDSSSGNLNITIPQMTGDYEIYNLYRKDNTSNIVNIILDNSNLITGESTFNFYEKSIITLMSLNNEWVIIAGYSKDR